MPTRPALEHSPEVEAILAELSALREWAVKVVAAGEAFDQKATAYNGEDGFISHYTMPTGPWHRILGLIRCCPFIPEVESEWRTAKAEGESQRSLAMPTRESTEPESGWNFYDAINCLKVAADEMELGTECLVAGIMQDEHLTAADRRTIEELRDRLERFTDWFELPVESQRSLAMPTREDDVINDGLVDRMNLVSAKSNEKFFRERAERFEAALRRVTDCGDRPAVQIAAEALMEMSDDATGVHMCGSFDCDCPTTAEFEVMAASLRAHHEKQASLIVRQLLNAALGVKA